jgi:hypothetical protein
VILPRGSIITVDNGTTNGALSEHGREPISMSVERIGSKERMLNGTMRAGFVANKYTLDISWSMLPSDDNMIADTGHGAKWIKDFYEETTGTVAVDLLYDGTHVAFDALMTSFSYNIQKRSQGGFDLVDVSLTLEEV